MRKPNRHRQLQIEALEGKALLSSLPTTFAGLHGASAVSATRAGDGAALARAAQAARPQAVRALQDGGPAFGERITNERFLLRGGKTSYEMDLDLAGREVNQDYDLRVNRVRNNQRITNGGFTAADSADIFFNRLASQIDLAASTGFDGRNTDGFGQERGFDLDGDGLVDAYVERESFRSRDGKLNYELTLRSGGYRFRHDYQMKVDRQDRGGSDAGYTAIDALAIFAERFFAVSSQRVGGGFLA